MRILMLGNSFTFYNDMPQTLAKLTGAQVAAHTRGGAWLSEPSAEEREKLRRFMEEEIRNGRVDVSWAELRKLIAESAAEDGQEET